MQPKTEGSAGMGKRLAASFLCDFGHISLSMTPSSYCKESSEDTASPQLAAARSSIWSRCQGLDDHSDRQC